MLCCVMDTNFLLAHLPWIQLLEVAAPAHQLTIVIPWAVVNELDGLKTTPRNNNGSFEVGAAARAAVRFLHSSLSRPQPLFVHVQQLSECPPLPTQANNDDHIMACAVMCASRTGQSNTILLTNDAALCVKALASGVHAANWESLPPLLSTIANAGEGMPQTMDMDVIDASDLPGWHTEPDARLGAGRFAREHSIAAVMSLRLIKAGSSEVDMSKEDGSALLPPPPAAMMEVSGVFGDGAVHAVFTVQAPAQAERMLEVDPRLAEHSGGILRLGYSEIWGTLREVGDLLSPEAQDVMRKSYGFDWLQLVPKLPWDIGDLLHVVRKHWRDVFSKRWGQSAHDSVCRLQDLVRSLRRTQQVTVKDTSDGLSALWAIAAAGGVLDGERGCRPVILASEKYLLSEARRQFLGEDSEDTSSSQAPKQDEDPRYP